MSLMERSIYAPRPRREPGFGPIDPREDEPRRGALLLGVSATVLLALIGVIWSTYHQGVREGGREGPPHIAALPGPYKIAPENPGGEQTAHLGVRVFDVLERPAAAPTAAPTQIAQAAAPDAPAPESIDPAIARAARSSAQVLDHFDLARADPAAAAEPGDVPVPRLKPLERDPDDEAAPGERTDRGPRTLATVGDPNRRYFASRQPMTRAAAGDATPARAAAPAPAPATPAITNPAVETPTSSAAAARLTPAVAAPTPVATQPPAPTPTPVPTTAATTAAAAPQASAAASAAGAFMVQVASYRTAAAADVGWAQFSGEYGDLIGSYRRDIARADLGDRGVRYRLRVGVFSDRAAAASFCDTVKARGGECLVVRS